MDYLLTFHTQLDAVIARKALSSKNVEIKLSPVPRSLSSSCGTCAKVYNVEKDILKDVEMEELYKINGDEYIKEFI